MDGPAPATPRRVVRRLLGAGVIAPVDAVDGDVVARDVSRSNGVVVVEAGALEVVVKGEGLAGAEGRARLGREARFYERLAVSERLARAAPAPRLHARLDDLLVLARTRPGETLEERARRLGPSPRDLLLLGRAVGAWRRISPAFADPSLPGLLPWALDSLELRPPDAVRENTGASHLAEAIRSDEALRDGIARLRRRWRPDAVVHGDVRWDNALLERDPSSGSERVVLVDWEHLDVGDAGWDVAGALADLVVLEAFASGSPGNATYRRALPDDIARLWSALGPSFGAFARGYRSEAPAESADGDLRAGFALLPARVLNVAFLHAAWSLSDDLSSSLALAGVAAGLLEHRPEGIDP